MSLADDFVKDAGTVKTLAPASAATGSSSLATMFQTDADGAPVATGPSAAYLEGRNMPAPMRTWANIINGPTFGFGDRILGAAGGAIDTLNKGGSFGDNYLANRDAVRGALDVDKETKPWEAGLTNLMASAPLAALMPVEKGIAWAMPKLAPYVLPVSNAARQGMGALEQASRAVTSSALNGAVYGAGNSRADNLTDQAGDAAKGGLMAAVTGGALSPIFQGGSAVIGNVAQRVSDGSALQAAREKIAEALSRDAQGSLFKSGAANPVSQATARFNTLGPAATVADSAGKSTRELLDTLAVLPGDTKDAAAQLLRNRAAGSANRLIASADDAMGTYGLRLNGTVNDLIDVRAKAAAPLYEQVNKAVISQPSMQLQSALMAADSLGATKLGQVISTARQVPYTLDPANPAGWALRDLDHVKQGLDTMIAKEWDAVNGQLTPKGAALQELKTNFVNALDNATTNRATGASLYKDARDAFAGPSALIDAARAGQAAMNKPEAVIGQTLSTMSQSEQDAFRVGAMEALRQKLGTSSGGRTEVMNMWQNPAMADKLKYMFGDAQAFRQFAATAAKEDILKKLQSTGVGSQTAARQFGAGDMDAQALKDAGAAVGALAGGHPVGAIAAAKNFWNGVKMPEPVRNAMGQILLSQGPAGRQNLGAMSDLGNYINQTRGRMALGTGLLAAQPLAGSVIGSNLLPGLLNP